MYLLAPQRPFVQLTTLTLSGKIKLLELLKPFTTVNPQALVAQKITDEVVFRRLQGEGVDFFLIGPH